MPGFEFSVPALYGPRRIDVFLAEALEGRFSRQEIKRALQAGRIFLNGQAASPKTQLAQGDLIRGELLADPPSALSAEKMDLKIVYEDDDVLVIDKPAGMVVHPGAGNKTGTLVNALLGKGGSLSTVGGFVRPGIVHRLDKQTSGLLIVAKNNAAHRALQSQFGDRSLSRTYTALVKGHVAFEEGHVDEPMGRHPKIRQKMAVSRLETAKEAKTQYRVIKRFKFATLLELKLMTGRTHQIRVHMAHLGHPVVGDTLYGSKDIWKRHALHASKIEFVHPKSGKMMRFESPLPEDFKEILNKYEHER